MDDWTTEPAWSTPRTPWEVPAVERPAPPTEPADPGRSRQRLVAVAVAIGLLGGLLSVVGLRLLADDDDRPPQAQSAPGSTSIPTTAPTTVRAVPGAGRVDPEGVDAELLRGLGLRGSDVPPDTAVRLLPGGNQVVGQRTLDLCDASYASEARRAARLQVVGVVDRTTLTVSTEAVLYDSKAATIQAFAELRQETARCPASTLRFNDPPDRSWPQVAGVERLAFDFVATDATGGDRHSIVVYLRRGRALLGIYLPRDGASPASVAGQTEPEAIVRVFAERMAALPPSIESP